MSDQIALRVRESPIGGSRLAFSQEFADAPALISWMIVILVLGMLADAVFSSQSRRMRARRGLAVD